MSNSVRAMNKSLGANSGSREPSPDGLGPSDPGRLEDAIAFAAHCHKGQADKAGQPYILHPLRVMLKLDSEDKRIAAVLHDVVEGCAVEPIFIRMCYGDVVADAVDALTRRKGESYPAFIERCGQNEIARAVKWADLCDNMDLSRLSAITVSDLKRQEKYQAARDRLNAIAMEARQGGDHEDERHPKDDSAGPQDIAHTPPPSSNEGKLS